MEKKRTTVPEAQVVDVETKPRTLKEALREANREGRTKSKTECRDLRRAERAGRRIEHYCCVS